jgi:pyruvate,orthophosphate dikinase
VRSARRGITVKPEVMIPLVATHREFEHQAAIVRKVAGDVLGAMGVDVEYLVGTMIELPRAALTADEIARSAEFFSFGTNDLTQTVLGLSRDDAGGSCRRTSRRGSSRRPVHRARRARRGKIIRRAIFDGGRRARRSRWACAASTAASRSRCASSTGAGSTT